MHASVVLMQALKAQVLQLGQGDCIHQDPLADKGGEETSVAE